MKKLFTCIVALLFATSLVACGNKQSSKVINENIQQNDKKTETYLLPNSYFDFIGTSVEESVESCLSLGEDFCTDAKVTKDGMQLTLTKTQLKNLINRYDNFSSKLKKDFENSNELYRCELDKNYKKLTLYYDENIPIVIHMQTVLGITASYGMNYMLQNNTTDWNVQVEVRNCHTNKLVVTVNIPSEKVSFGDKEWKASYK